MVKNKKQFWGLSNKEKKLIKEKKDDIKLDLSIKCYGYADIYEICYEDDLESMLDVLEIHLPFIKEQKETILEMYEESDYEVEYTKIDDLLCCIDDVVGEITIDVEKINSKFFERAKELIVDNEYNSFIDDLFDDLFDDLHVKFSNEGTTEEKIEIMKMYLQKNK